MPPAILGSWKEIAQYLGKGVRTVQRWEHELKLPVHRPSGGRKGVVIAFPQELENWARQQVTSGNPDIRVQELKRMHASSAMLIERTALLRKNLEKVHDECLKAWTTAQRGRKFASERVAAGNGNGNPTSRPTESV